MPPLIEVTGITYVDPSGNLQSLDPSPEAGNVLISAGTPGQMTPAYAKIFPVTQPILSAVNITFTAGYGTDATTVPPPVIAAMYFLVTYYYENRTSSVPTPQQVINLLDSVYWGGYN